MSVDFHTLQNGKYYLYERKNEKKVLQLIDWDSTTYKTYPFRFILIPKRMRDNKEYDDYWLTYDCLKFLTEISKDRAFLEIV